jgi:hypothetical protein
LGGRCLLDSLGGSGSLCLSSVHPHTITSSEEGSLGGLCSNSAGTSVAISAVVSSSGGSSDRRPSP